MACIAQLCDTVAVCFTPLQQVIAAAAKLAHRMQDRASGDIEILPVATQFDDRWAEQIRSLIHNAFAEFRNESGGPDRSDDVVEIPPDGFGELLAVLAEESSEATGLTTAYERLAAALTRAPS